MRTLRFRLVLLVFIAVLPMLGMAIYSGLEQRNLASEKAVADAFRFTRLVSEYQSSLVSITEHRLLSLSLSANIYNPADCPAYMNAWQQLNQVYSQVVITNLTGKITCSSQSGSVLPVLSGQPYFVDSLLEKKNIVGPPYVDQGSGKTLLPVVVPVLDSQQKVTMFVVSSIDLKQVIDYAANLSLPNSSAMLMVDSHGTVLMRYPDTEAWAGQNLPNVPIIQEILSNKKEGSAEANGVDGVSRLYAFSPVLSSFGYTYFISVGIPSSTAYADATRIFAQSLAWTVIAFLAVFIAAWFAGDFFFLRVVSLTAERDAAEQKLREANAELENRVQARTAELADVNEKLKLELAERQRTLQALHQRESEQRHLVKLLERSNQDLQDFAFITSHDLQEPLRKIQAFGERLSQRYGGRLDEEGEMFISRMVIAAARMQAMINALLDYSRVSTRGGELSSVDLNTVMREVLSSLEVRIQQTGARVEVENLPPVEADPTQMTQLMQNLLVNALKFHRPEVAPVVKVRGEVNNGNGSIPQVTITVEDNGIGFEEQYLDRIFQPFQRLYSKDTYEGSGIGLSVCRKIVQRHNGEITARSTPGQGSCFIVTLPGVQQKRNSNDEP